jgi:HD superfamily phosphodiesterase
MNTKKGKKLAERKHSFVVSFLKEFEKECKNR